MYLTRLLRGTALVLLGTGLLATLLVIPLFAAYSFLLPVRVTGDATPGDRGIAYDAVRFRGDGVELSGWFMPGNTRHTVVLVHGIHSNQSDFLDLSEALHALGYSVMTFDMRGHGRSEGTFTTYGFHEAKDVLSAVEYLQSRPDVDPSGVALIGFSLGAVSVIQAGAVSPHVRGVVADSSFAMLSEQLTVTGQGLGPLAVLLPLIQLYGSWLGGIDVPSVQPVASVTRLGTRPLLLIHGGDDQAVPPDNSRRLFEAASGPKELWIVPGAAHVASTIVAGDEYYERVGAFLARVFGR